MGLEASSEAKAFYFLTKLASYLRAFRQSHELSWLGHLQWVSSNEWQHMAEYFGGDLHCFRCLKHVLFCFPTSHPTR